MHRLAYPTTASRVLVVNHSVTVGSGVGVRWYEIRSPNGTPASISPAPTRRLQVPLDGQHRDGQGGNIALGYSTSSSSQYPGIAYTGRARADSLGTLQARNPS